MGLKEFYNLKIKYQTKFSEDQLALDFFKKCENILDIGCGSGRFISYMPDRIVGLEGNSETVKKLLELGFKVVEAVVPKLPFEDNFFAGIHCSHLIEHLGNDDAYKLLCEIDRVLKPGGILCLRAPMMHRNFFDEFGHIRPYPPNAILAYLNEKANGTQTQYKNIKGKYKILTIDYQHGNLLDVFANSPLSFLTAVGNILLRFNISRLEKVSFIMILEKLDKYE